MRRHTLPVVGNHPAGEDGHTLAGVVGADHNRLAEDMEDSLAAAAGEELHIGLGVVHHIVPEEAHHIVPGVEHHLGAVTSRLEYRRRNQSLQGSFWRADKCLLDH